MFSTIALAAVLSNTPAQPAALALTNSRLTYGEFGATRPDTRFLPGDLFFVAFDMENLSIGPDGRVGYTMAMEVTNAKGESMFKPDPVVAEEILPLGGTKLPARAFLILRTDQAPGVYTCKVQVTDSKNKAVQALERKFEVLAADFGLVGLFTSSDMQGSLPTPPVAVAGQKLYVNFALVAFGRDAGGRPDTTVEVRMLENGQTPTLAVPMTMTVPKDIDPKASAVPFQVPLPLNREGSFTMEIKATDKAKNKSVTFTYVVRVLPAAR